MTAREFWESGLLYHVNESVLWPLGLAIAISVDKGNPDDEGSLSIVNFGEVIQDPDPSIRARANHTLASLFTSVKP